jgi:hypothetical protein
MTGVRNQYRPSDKYAAPPATGSHVNAVERVSQDPSDSWNGKGLFRLLWFSASAHDTRRVGMAGRHHALQVVV